MDNRNASMKHHISNNYKKGEMADDEKNTKGNNKEKQVSMSLAESESKTDQPGSSSPSPQSSVSSAGSSGSTSSFLNVPESNGSVNVLSCAGSDSSFGEVGEEPSVTLANSKDEDDQRSSQPSLSLFNLSLPPASDNGLSKASDITSGEGIDNYDLSWPFLEGGGQIPHPENLEPGLTLSSTSKKSEQVNNTTLPNTKSSNLHIIAASVLAIAGVALGVAIAVHLEMLAVGIAVGACCLVAAAVMHYYKWPSSFIENNQIEKVHLMRRKDL